MEDNKGANLILSPYSEIELNSTINSSDSNVSQIRYGNWCMNEHFRFLYGALMVNCDWTKMENIIRTRTISQIKSHSQKYIQQIIRIKSSSTNSDQVKEDYKGK